MSRTAGEAGWRVSRYNLAARIPDSDKIAVANLFRGTCGAYTPIEMYLLDELDSLDENHPILVTIQSPRDDSLSQPAADSSLGEGA